MAQNIKQYGWNKYSQFNEDGIIEEVLHRIGPISPVCVEFGGHDGTFCSNTKRLIEQGWQGYMYDINPGHPSVIRKEITPDNVNELPPCSVLSIDCDGPDAGIWAAYKGRPDMAIIEINSSLDPNVDFYHPSKGSNYSYMKRLGEAKGYTLLCHTGNMLFVLNKHAELFQDRDETFNTSWLC